jgi:alpha-D-xyloside xylohydrolase
LIRWFEYGAFCPLFRIHGYQSETEMWKFGPKVERVLHEYDNLRYRLMPYIYSSAWEVTSQGESMMRALPLDYANDRNVLEISDQFLFGSSLLINPVTKPGATRRNVYLPAGQGWVDFWTGKRFSGGQTIEADSPIDRMPIFVQAGSILALGPIIDSTEQLQNAPLDIRLYPGRNGSFTLYEDEGDSYRYEKGIYSTISFSWNDSRRMLSIGDRKGDYPGMAAKRTFRIVLVGEGTGIGAQPDEAGIDVHYTGRAQTVRLDERRSTPKNLGHL